MTDKAIDLRTQAANDKAWCEARMVQYREDGATPPEPIRRLTALADLAISETPGLAAQNAGLNDREIVKLGAWIAEHSSADVDAGWATNASTPASAAIKMLERLTRERDEARSRSALALRESASVLVKVAEALVAEASETRMVPIVRADGTKTEVRVTAPPGTTFRQDGVGPMMVMTSAPGPAPIVNASGDAPIARALFPLRHGLVVIGGSPRHRVLFSEPRPGGWVAQTVSEDGSTLGPETVTEARRWLADEWAEDGPIAAKGPAHWSEVKRPQDGPAVAPQQGPALAKGEQAVIPGAGPAAPQEGPKTCGQWEPSARDIATTIVSLNEAMGKVGLPANVDEARVKDLLAKFRTDPVKSVLVTAKPGTVFYHYAVKMLKEASAQNGAAA